MKHYWLFVLTLSASCLLNGQTLEWHRLFDKHSLTATAGITPNSLLTPQGSLLTIVTEDDILKISRTDAAGNPQGMLDTGSACGTYTPLIPVENGRYALIYNSTPLAASPVYRFLEIDSDLAVTRHSTLQFPFSTSGTILYHLLRIDGHFYGSFQSGASHILCEIHPDNSVTETAAVPANPFQEEQWFAAGASRVVFSYGYGQQHRVRCLDLAAGTQLWEFTSPATSDILLDYLIIPGENDVLYVAGLERFWDDSGNSQDHIRLSRISTITGGLIQSALLDLPADCATRINDLSYHTALNRLYLSYSRCFPQPGIVVTELLPSLEVLQETARDTQQDNLNIGVEAYLHPYGTASLALLYKSLKNDTEKGNLYISSLLPDLSDNGALEIHWPETASSETVTHILPYDAERILITGIVPNPDPLIFWEEVHYFIAMVNLSAPLERETPRSAGLPVLYPNPADDTICLNTREPVLSFRLYNPAGKEIETVLSSPGHCLEVSHLPRGLYFLEIKNSDTTHTLKWIKK